ncbi:uncharacterized protein LOC133181127 [Saccostrea echinata]|uniref:uncharacterized protein LOC133181127 n=1 Tax=Saccostrea echinata TaxID=191078 RepID=UPI002A82EA07|nr:uncharacterized protein LOC133181127 [Saccostrea echinata]
MSVRHCEYGTRSSGHLKQIPVASNEDGQGNIKDDQRKRLKSLRETLHVPHYDRLVNLDLIFNSKVSVILEDGDPGDPLSFSVETEENQFQLPQSGSLSLSHTSSFHGRDTLNVTVHLSDSTPWSSVMVWWSLCVGALVAVTLYQVVPLSCTETSGDEDTLCNQLNALNQINTENIKCSQRAQLFQVLLEKYPKNEIKPVPVLAI